MCENFLEELCEIDSNELIDSDDLIDSDELIDNFRFNCVI